MGSRRRRPTPGDAGFTARHAGGVVAVVVALAGAGCDGDTRETTGETTTASPASTDHAWRPTRTRVVRERLVVAVVDDAPTPAARALRSYLADVLRDAAGDDLPEKGALNCLGVDPTDPAVVWPVRLRVHLVAASRPLDPPTFLDLRTDDATADVVAAWGTKLTAGLEALETTSVERARYLDGVEGWAQSGRGGDVMATVVAATRRDASDWNDVEAGLGGGFFQSLILPEEVEDRCADDDLLGRFPSLTEGVDRRVFLSDGSCDRPVAGAAGAAGIEVRGPVVSSSEFRLFDLRKSSGGHSRGRATVCKPATCQTPPEDPDSCVLEGRLPPDYPCPEDLGWLDPVRGDRRRPRIVDDPEVGLVRLCEVRRLTGAAGESCRTTRSCDDCEPGWCLRAPWSSDRPCGDAIDRRRWRIVRGADLLLHEGELRWRCDPEGAP